jgi:hypothetical protein
LATNAAEMIGGLAFFKGLPRSITVQCGGTIARLSAGNPEAEQDLKDLALQADDHHPFADPY